MGDDEDGNLILDGSKRVILKSQEPKTGHFPRYDFKSTAKQKGLQNTIDRAIHKF